MIQRWARKAALVWIAFMIALVLVGPTLAPFDPIQPYSGALSPPQSPHFLGTDHLGRDLLSRLLYGGRISLGAASVATILTLSLGIGFGMTAGMLGGLPERILLWLANSMLAIPGLLLAMLFVASLGPGLLPVVLSVGIGGVPGFTRLTRTTTLQILEQTYIEAAKALGASQVSIALRHVLPNALRQLTSFGTTYFAWALLGTTTLTFLGLAGEPSLPEWGAMLNESRVYLVEAPWVAFWPALILSLTMLAIHTLSDRLSTSNHH